MKQLTAVAAWILAGAILAGCAAGENYNALKLESDGLMDQVARAQVLEESLFKEDQGVISNEDMAKVLAAKVVLPAGAKLTVVRFGQLPHWWGWSESFVRMNEQIDTGFLDKLRSAKRVDDVAYLPSLVTPKQMTIPYLRQAAARFQSDLMLVYRTMTRTYDKQRLFARDRSRSYCTVEAILIDTRTGTIPFSTVVTEHFMAVETASDLTDAETAARAEQQAIARAWNRLAEQTVAYLDGLP